MLDEMLPGFSLPAIGGKKVTAAFDGGRLSSDGGVFLLAAADQRLGLTETLAGLIPDPRDPARVTYTVAEMVRARVFAIGCGYPDADDLDTLRRDPAFKLACGRLPESGADLASQPTLSRLENAPDLRALLRLAYAMVDLWCRSHARPPRAITLDIDDTLDVVHGHQPPSLFNAHYDERCFLPIHVYEAESGHCVAAILRHGKTPDGRGVRGHLRRLIRHDRSRAPAARTAARLERAPGRRIRGLRRSLHRHRARVDPGAGLGQRDGRARRRAPRRLLARPRSCLRACGPGVRARHACVPLG